MPQDHDRFPQRSPASEPLPRSALHREVAERLRDLVVEGVLAAGEPLNERLLCARFGVSRTPFREAVLVLAAEGLLEVVPRRGARVVPLGAEQIHDILEVLGGLEALAGELACVRARDAEIASIDAMHAEMRTSYRVGDMLAYFKTNEAIHDAIVAAAHNPLLVTQHRQVRTRALHALFVPNVRAARWERAVAEHDGFIAALASRDGVRLGASLRAHRQATWLELCAHFEGGEPQPAAACLRS